jgi:hypothetical protein
LPQLASACPARRDGTASIRQALFWTNRTAIAIGCGYGVLLAGVVRFGAALTTHTTAIAILLGAAGFSLPDTSVTACLHTSIFDTEETMRLPAQISAPGCYLMAVIALFVWHFGV